MSGFYFINNKIEIRSLSECISTHTQIRVILLGLVNYDYLIHVVVPGTLQYILWVFSPWM